jgi:hypothetical protein
MTELGTVVAWQRATGMRGQGVAIPGGKEMPHRRCAQATAYAHLGIPRPGGSVDLDCDLGAQVASNRQPMRV